MAINFHETVMGKQFIQGTMPAIARSLETIAEEMQKKNAEEKKDEKELWLLIRVSGLQGGCMSEVHQYKNHAEVFRTMESEIASYVSVQLSLKEIPVNFDEVEKVTADTIYDVQYGDYAAEVYKSGKPIAIWCIERVKM